MESGLIIANAALSLFMTGVIVFVQIVAYPLFSKVPPETFAEFHDDYRRRISFVVVPAMLLELAVALLIAIIPPTGTVLAARLALIPLAAAWLSTFFLQVPAHERLSRGYDAAEIGRLVATNWIRAFSWATRGAIAVFMLFTAFSNR
jgi:hypothetical protein